MVENSRCPRCGAALVPEAPQGLCAKCLLEVGLQTQSQAPGHSGAEAGFTPPPIADLNALLGQYEFLELLGKGGMGAVYKARQKSLDRVVAIKILPPRVGLDPTFAERFTREARALARLNHPHIVGVHDFGEVPTPPTTASGAGALYYFVMEFVEGVNLRQAIRAQQLKPAEALQIVPQICDALQYAHEEGVVHRDIKPENILLDKRGRVKIADFGLAKLLGKTTEELTLTGTRQIVGTIPYMAPEQIEGSKDIDHRADIYSLGVTFYEMLTGELPLGRFPPPSRKVQVDLRIDEVVLRTLEKAPELRYQQAGQVKDEVETISRTPRGRPFTTMFKDVAAEVYRTSRRAGAWVADKLSGVGSSAQQQAAALADEHLPPERTAGERRGLIWLVALGALALLGLWMDQRGRHSLAPWGTIFGIAPLILFAWIQRGTTPGRWARNLAVFLGVVALVQLVLIIEPEVFILIVLGVVAALLLERWWVRRTDAAAVATPAVEPERPV